MSRFMLQEEFYNQPVGLTAEQILHPFKVLEDFFVDHDLSELRAFFEEVGETCLTSDEPPFSRAGKRADLLYYHRKLENLLEAAYVIAQLKK
jgi:hypothetical protein